MTQLESVKRLSGLSDVIHLHSEPVSLTVDSIMLCTISRSRIGQESLLIHLDQIC